MIDQSEITSEMAQAELDRRQSARDELDRRQKIGAGNNMLQSINQSAPTQFVLGAGDALHNAIAGTANLLPGVNLPLSKFGQGTAYDVGELAGNIGAFAGGGEVAGAARGAAEAAPYIGKLAQALGEGKGAIAGRAAGSALFGAATNPQDKLKSAGEGAGLSAALDIVPAGIGKIAAPFKPQEHADKLMKALSGGNSLEENAKSLAEDIKNAYNKQKRSGSALYKPVFNELGDKSIYAESSPYASEYKALNEDVLGSYDRDLKKLHEKFTRNPTLQNAHGLQSQLGTSLRDLDKTHARVGLSAADRNAYQSYRDARESVTNDISNFLESKNPILANQYNSATRNWAENVVPYVENPKISKIAKGEITNPRALNNVFKSPESDILKVVEDLGPTAKNKIVFSEVGKSNVKNDPKKLAKALENLDVQGLGSYKTPELSEMADTLSKKIIAKDLLQRGTGAIGAGSLGAHLGVPFSESIAALGGAALGPALFSGLNKFSPLAHALSQKLSGPAKKALIGGAIPQEPLDLGTLTNYKGTY